MAEGQVQVKIMAPESAPKPIDLRKTFTVILTYPDHTIPMELAWWFMRTGFVREQIGAKCKKGSQDLVRNEVLSDLMPLLEKYEWVIFLDNDMRPNSLTDLFLVDRPDADVVACNYTNNPTSTITPEAFHMGLVRVRTETLKKVIELTAKDGQPAFLFPRNPEQTATLSCECHWFGKRLKAVGAKIVRVGFCGHSKSVTIA
jgi:hypothetical protein